MNVNALAEALSLYVFNLSDPEAEVTSGYCGDLLSWVMGRAPAGSAWLTIMSNANVAAVASLADTGCVILTEGVRPEPDLLSKAQAHGINLLGSDLDTYSVAARLSAALETLS